MHFITGDAFRLRESVHDTLYDVVFHQGLLEHFSDAEIAKLLEQQLEIVPVIVFSVPTPEYEKQDLGNERLIPPSSWLDILQRYGFHVIEHCSYLGVVRRPRVPTTLGHVRLCHLAFMAKLMCRK